MRRGLLPLAAALLLLPGCHQYWGGSSSSSATVTLEPSSAEAEAKLRNAIPAVEAYNADHGSYQGMTLEVLESYDNTIVDITVVDAGKRSYCLESIAGGSTYSYRGPAGGIAPVPCSVAPAPAQVETPPPPASYDARTNLQIAIPAIEAWRLDHGTYAGMTLKKLREQYDYGIPLEVEVVEASQKEYCIESSVHGETWSYHGPKRGLRPGGC
jgi:hypothetical protein